MPCPTPPHPHLLIAHLKVSMRSFDKISHIYFDWSGTLAPSGTKRDFIAEPRKLEILYPDTLPVLHELRRRGYILGLIVNTSKRGFRRALIASGIQGIFNGPIILSNDAAVPCKKPCADIFKLAIGATNPAHTLMVGNDEVKDIAGAAAAGMKTFRIVRHGPATTNLADLLI